MADPALELVLPESAELQEIVPSLLEPSKLAELWQGDSISVQAVMDYFAGDKVVQVQRDGYMEPMAVPKASDDVIKEAITKSVESGSLWLTNGPASVLAEPIPTCDSAVVVALPWASALLICRTHGRMKRQRQCLWREGELPRRSVTDPIQIDDNAPAAAMRRAACFESLRAAPGASTSAEIHPRPATKHQNAKELEV